MKKVFTFLMLVSFVFAFIACENDSEPQVNLTKTEFKSTPAPAGNSNAKFSESNYDLASQLAWDGYTQDENDVEHYYYYVGGTNDVTYHFRGDAVIPDKYRILYESSNHVGEELLYNGYIVNYGVYNQLQSMLGFDILY